MTSLDQQIRARLDTNGHEDWCPEVAHKTCCDGECECAVGGLLKVAHAVLDLLGEAPHHPRAVVTVPALLNSMASALGITQETTHD